MAYSTFDSEETLVLARNYTDTEIEISELKDEDWGFITEQEGD